MGVVSALAEAPRGWAVYSLVLQHCGEDRQREEDNAETVEAVFAQATDAEVGGDENLTMERKVVEPGVGERGKTPWSCPCKWCKSATLVV